MVTCKPHECDGPLTAGLCDWSCLHNVSLYNEYVTWSSPVDPPALLESDKFIRYRQPCIAVLNVIFPALLYWMLHLFCISCATSMHCITLYASYIFHWYLTFSCQYQMYDLNQMYILYTYDTWVRFLNSAQKFLCTFALYNVFYAPPCLLNLVYWNRSAFLMRLP